MGMALVLYAIPYILSRLRCCAGGHHPSRWVLLKHRGANSHSEPLRPWVQCLRFSWIIKSFDSKIYLWTSKKELGPECFKTAVYSQPCLICTHLLNDYVKQTCVEWIRKRLEFQPSGMEQSSYVSCVWSPWRKRVWANTICCLERLASTASALRTGATKDSYSFFFFFF